MQLSSILASTYTYRQLGSKRLQAAIGLTAAGLAAAVFLWFAGDGMRAYFTPDDVMNLYTAVFSRATAWDRPAGTWIYRALFQQFGLNPLPYRAACFALLGTNLWLLWTVCRKLSGSVEVAGVAILLGAYHAHLADLYYSTGTIFDLLCFLFYFGALRVYMWARERPSRLGVGLTLALYLGALAAKEIAVTLPLFLLLYDLLYHPPSRRRDALPWVGREALRVGPAVLVTAAYVYYKTMGAGRMTGNSDYLPAFSWQVLTYNWRHYAHDLFYGASQFAGWRIVALWLAVIGLAAVLRRRDAWMGAALCLLGILPVVLIPERGFYAVYLTLPGWYLLGARALASARERAFPHAGAVGPICLLLVLAACLVPLHARQKPRGNTWVSEAYQSVRRTLEPLQHYQVPRGAAVLVVDDPYAADDSILLGIFKLRYRDENITLRRGGAREGEHYDTIFGYGGGGTAVPSSLVLTKGE